MIIALSGKLSDTAKNAAAAAARLGSHVWVVDSGTVSIGQGILLRYAIRLRDRGLTGRQISSELDRAKIHIHMLVRLDTLEYLRRGGRIPRTKSLMGDFMRIKPVICVEEGEIRFLGNTKGSAQGDNLLMEFVRASGGVDFSMPVMVAYSGMDNALLKGCVGNSRTLWEGKIDRLPITVFHSAITSHSGPGAIGVAFFSNDYHLYHW